MSSDIIELQILNMHQSGYYEVGNCHVNYQHSSLLRWFVCPIAYIVNTSTHHNLQNIQCESKKIPPAVFWHFFPHGWEFLINFYTPIIRSYLR